MSHFSAICFQVRLFRPKSMPRESTFGMATNTLIKYRPFMKTVYPAYHACSLSDLPRAPYTLSVKLSDFTVWRHTWRKNWVNRAVLTGNSTGLGTVLYSRLSHTELRSSLRESHTFLSLPADTTMASPQGTQPQHPFPAIHSADEHRMIYSFLNTTSYSTFYAFFSSFRITLWPMWLANSKRQPCFYPP
jgi:hypothetical protein